MQNSQRIVRPLQWVTIKQEKKSILTSISMVTLTPTVKLWHASYDPKLFSTKNYLIKKSLYEAGLEIAAIKRQAEFWAGRCLMMHVFCQDMPLGKSKFGSPIFPNGKNGSLSHSSNDIFLLEGTDKFFFGVDIEPLLMPVSLQAVLSRVATETERTWLRSLSSKQLVYASTILFSAKETLFKLLNKEIPSRLDYGMIESKEAPSEGFLIFELTRRANYRLVKGKRFVVRYYKIKGKEITWSFIHQNMHYPGVIFL